MTDVGSASPRSPGLYFGKLLDDRAAEWGWVKVVADDEEPDGLWAWPKESRYGYEIRYIEWDLSVGAYPLALDERAAEPPGVGLRFIFTKPGDGPELEFVEVEDVDGRSVKVGSWTIDNAGRRILSIPARAVALCADEHPGFDHKEAMRVAADIPKPNGTQLYSLKPFDIAEHVGECPSSGDGFCYPETDGHCHWCDRMCL